MRNFYAVLLLLLAIGVSDANARKVLVDVGGTKIMIPAPHGFVEVGEEYRDLFNGFVPPGNQLLAFFVAEADLTKLLEYQRTWEHGKHEIIRVIDVLPRVIFLQTNKGIANKIISKSDFEHLVKIEEEQLVNLKTELDDEYLKKRKERLRIKNMDTFLLKKPFKADNFFLTTFFTSMNVGNRRISMIHSGSTLNLEGNYLDAAVYARANNKEWVDWVERTTELWTMDILRRSDIIKVSNSKTAFNRGRSKFDWAIQTVKSLVMGLLVALLFLLVVAFKNYSNREKKKD